MPAMTVQGHREPLAVRHRVVRSGFGALSWDKRIAGMILSDVTLVYSNITNTVDALEKPLKSLEEAYEQFRKTLSMVAMKSFVQAGGFGFMGAVGGGVAAVNAVMASLAQAKRHGVDPAKAKEAVLAIADSLKHSDMALEAFRMITLGDLVRHGIIRQADAQKMATRVGLGQFWSTMGLEGLATDWAKKYGSTLSPSELVREGRRYVHVYGRIKERLAKLAKLMGLEGKYTLTDPGLAKQIKTKLLEEMKVAHDKVRRNQPPTGWGAALFNRAVEILMAAPGYLIFGVAGVVFGKFMGPVIQMDAGMSRAAFAAARLVAASSAIAGAGVKAYVRTFKTARVDERQSEAVARSKATQAAATAIAQTGRREYEQAYRDIEEYRNYAKQIQDAMQAFLANLMEFLKWAGIVTGVVVVGGLIVWKSV